MGWLSSHDAMDHGDHDIARFMARMRTIVMARATYDFIERNGADWPYGGHRVHVVTSRPITVPKGPLAISQDIDSLICQLRALDDGPVWMLGGGSLQMAFIARGALNAIEIFVFPELPGGRVPLFPATGLRRSLRLLSAATLDQGCFRLHCGFD